MKRQQNEITSHQIYFFSKPRFDICVGIELFIIWVMKRKFGGELHGVFGIIEQSIAI
ncbi:MAG: hypothetical protein G01um101416_1183, partial [Microgenomates group bacterium Gr01-1014_16]